MDLEVPELILSKRQRQRERELTIGDGTVNINSINQNSYLGQ